MVPSSTPPFAAEWEFRSESEAETDRLARALASALVSGTVVALIGPLGAGKTRFVQGVATALGVGRRDVASPTFVLIHEYSGRFRIHHFDAYRLRDTDEFLELGADELMHSDGVCLIEWADRVADALPADHLRVEIRPESPHTRTLRATATGPKSLDVASRWTANACSSQSVPPPSA